MKTCPYCAEEIQDGAVVCKHCGRDLPGVGPKGRANAPVRASIRRVIVGVAVGLVVIYGVLLVLRGQQARALLEEERQRQLALAAQPIGIRIGNGIPVEIKPRQYQDYSFVLPNRKCTLTGHVEGISGGLKDFEALVLSADDFKNWSTLHGTQAVQSGRVAAWTPSVPLAGPGTFHFVVSNAFSTVSTKVVTVDGAVTCP